jgi:hypothetical protein
MDTHSVILDIARANDLPATQNNELNREWLASVINELLNKDFQKLIAILYRVDVDEVKLRYLLAKNPDTDAGVTIADLLIERQWQKMNARASFRSTDKPIDENEKW